MNGDYFTEYFVVIVYKGFPVNGFTWELYKGNYHNLVDFSGQYYGLKGCVDAAQERYTTAISQDHPNRIKEMSRLVHKPTILERLINWILK